MLKEKHIRKIGEIIIDPLKSVTDVYFWIGGGVIRSILDGKPPKDIDVFFKNQDDKRSVIEACRTSLKYDFKCSSPTTECWLNQDAVRCDFIHYPGLEGLDPKKCLEYFDYTITCCAVDSNYVVFSDKRFFNDIKNKKLHYTGNHYHISNGRYEVCIRRLRKYISEGYSIDNLNEWLMWNDERWDALTSPHVDWKPTQKVKLKIERSDEFRQY